MAERPIPKCTIVVLATCLASCGRHRYLEESVDKLCRSLSAPHFCEVLREALEKVSWWTTQANISYALFLIVSILAALTGGSGVLGAAQAQKAAGEPKVAATFALWAGTVLGILTVVQSVVFAGGYGPLWDRAMTARRKLNAILETLDTGLPDEAERKRDLIGKLTQQLYEIDSLEPKQAQVDAGHGGIAYAMQPGSGAWVHSPPTDSDSICFVGIGVSASATKASALAVSDGIASIREFFISQIYPPPSEIDDRPASAVADFIAQTARKADESLRFVRETQLYHGYALLCIGRKRSASGLTLLNEANGTAVGAATKMLAASSGISPECYEVRDRGFVEAFKAARANLEGGEFEKLLEYRDSRLDGQGRRVCGALNELAHKHPKSCVVWHEAGLACQDAGDTTAAEEALRTGMRVEEDASLCREWVALAYAKLLQSQGKGEEALPILEKAVKDDPACPRPVAALNEGRHKAGESSRVRLAQKYLRQSGYYHGEIDGTLGQVTVEALQKFQRENQLEPDGYPGGQTMRKLESMAGRGSSMR
jgi:tetratricopeptide (TPR) repeat protein